MKKIDLSEKVA